jgi:hypothetical protein
LDCLGNRSRLPYGITAGNNKIITKPGNFGNIQDDYLLGLLGFSNPSNALR